ncbi:MAG: AsmA family protein [Myxococcota bacterium]|nr:AsmA family protein [Myxococcota bacterium]
MRIVVRIALAGLAVVVALVMGVAMFLPSWVESAGFRDEFERFAEENLGRTIDYGAVDIRFLPPRVEIANLEIGGSDATSAPAITARSAVLELSWFSLLRGRAVVDELVIDAATLRMVRTASGIDLLAAAVPAAPAAASAKDNAAPVSLERVSVRNATVVFDDRVAVPPVVWKLTETGIVATASPSGGAIDFDLAGILADASSVNVTGSVSLEGPITADVAVHALDVESLRSYAGATRAISGKLDIVAKLVRTSSEAPLEVDLSVSSAQLDAVVEELSVSGPLVLAATLKLKGETWSGPVRLELSEAALDYAAGTLLKAAGIPGVLAGKLVRREGSGTQLEYQLTLHNAVASGAIEAEPRLRIEVDAPPFDLTGWGEMIPALAEMDPTGTLGLEGMVFHGGPSDLIGSLVLGDVLIQSEGASALLLNGFLDALGNKLVPRDLTATAGTAKFAVEGEIADLFDDGAGRSLALNLVTPDPVESNDVFSLVEAMRDAVHGALALDADILLPLGADSTERSASERLVGDVHFQIGGDEAGGRLRGVSLLRKAFERFGALGHAALLALPAKRGTSMDEYYSEDFQVAHATFHIENGEARTQDFEVVHEKYTTRLRGGLRLSDLALDMRGEVVIGEELDAVLAGTESGRERIIPLARVGGTALDPTVSLKSEDIAVFTARYALGSNSKLGKKIDKALGAGASELLRGVLDAAGGKR